MFDWLQTFNLERSCPYWTKMTTLNLHTLFILGCGFRFMQFHLKMTFWLLIFFNFTHDVKILTMICLHLVKSRHKIKHVGNNNVFFISYFQTLNNDIIFRIFDKIQFGHLVYNYSNYVFDWLQTFNLVRSCPCWS